MKKEYIKKFAEKLKRVPESHKYDYGHILVIAGSKNMPGAGILCCNAAMRTGAGLVTYAVQEDFFTYACSMSKPETMFFVYKTAKDLLEFIEKRKVSAAVIGPGMLQSAETHKFILNIISNVKIPIILDASGLASFYDKTADLKKATAELIVTPHMGEFSKLIKKSIEEINGQKEKIVSDFADANSLVCVLKGNKTLVSDGKEVYKNDSGTPAMATAGSGDVLSGIIAAFTAITDDLFEAAKFAVYVHGIGGEFAETDKGYGIIASDITENICYALEGIMNTGGEDDDNR